MDRFIVNVNTERCYIAKILKSNMDRFIGDSVKGIPGTILDFKIQYG